MGRWAKFFATGTAQGAFGFGFKVLETSELTPVLGWAGCGSKSMETNELITNLEDLVAASPWFGSAAPINVPDVIPSVGSFPARVNLTGHAAAPSL
jgi:hypothetical protein